MAGATKSRMVETASRLLWSQGFHATGLNQILDESGTPKGSLYFHFPGGKEQLAIEALRAGGGIVTTAIVRALGKHQEVGTAMRELINAFARNLERSDFERGCPLATVTLEASSKSDALREVAEQLYAEWHKLIADRLVASGRERTRADALATLVLSSVEGALILSRAQRSVKPLRVVADEVANLL